MPWFITSHGIFIIILYLRAVFSMTAKQPTKKHDYYQQIKAILKEARSSVYKQVNSIMVQTYWNIGKLIVEEEQRGKKKANYGEKSLESLSARLSKDFGKGFSRQNLQNMRQFYLVFENCQTLSSKLSWSHYVLLMRVENERARNYYCKEAESEQWSVRELDRQINSMFFERLAISRNKSKVKALAEKGHIINSPEDAIKDPYILEFLGWPEHKSFSEKELETVLIDNLQEFLLELGKGFSFVARQKRITLDDEHFYIDLVFYNRLLKAFVLIDLKIGKLTHQDLGQMQMYVNYFDREVKEEDESATIGIVLCRDKKETVAKYTLPENNKTIFASKYKLYLPTEAELEKEIDEVTKEVERIDKK